MNDTVLFQLSAKLKMMFQTLFDTTISLKVVVEKHYEQSEPIDVKEVVSCFTTDAIASWAFGIKCNSLGNSRSEFRETGKLFMDNIGTRAALSFLIPHKLLHFFNIRLMSRTVERYFIDTVANVVKYRENNNIIRKDMIHLLMQLKNEEQNTEDETLNGNSNKTGDSLTLNQIAAQCFIFFMAGFDTSASTMTMALLELALHQDIQNTVREEIKSKIAENDGILDYDTVMKMKYFDSVICGKPFNFFFFSVT